MNTPPGDDSEQTQSRWTTPPRVVPRSEAATFTPEEAVRARSRLRVLCWRAVAVCFMALGVLGVILPLLPHVPFFLGALWASGKGWPRLEQWLLAHPVLGPQLRNWNERRAISTPVKVVTTLMMAGSAVGMQFYGDVPLWLRIAMPCGMLVGAIYMWTRPRA